MKYCIHIEETVSGTFEIDADDIGQAINNAAEQYKAGRIVLEPGNLIFKQMMGNSFDGTESTEWVEF